VSSRQTDDEGREVWGCFALSIAGMSHVGRIRQTNEDAFDRFDDASRSEILLVVADGMGGHRGGAVASAMAVGTLGSLCLESEAEAPARLSAAIERANLEIFERASDSRLYAGMGTTVVALLLSPGGDSWVAHVGDSRLYRLRDGSLRAVTTDHSLAAQLLSNGEITEDEARTHPRRTVLTRSVGVGRRVDVEVHPVDVCVGDAFVLCSDGIYEMLPEDEMCSLIAGAPDAHTAAAWLIDAANQHGGKDNSTALVVQVSGAT
jgi:protein phosphatase